MRRPMSIASQGDDNISIIYKAIGEGTRIMANWNKGSQVDMIGPLGNYSTFPTQAKWILSITMLVGRLEIFTFLVLLSVSFWKR